MKKLIAVALVAILFANCSKEKTPANQLDTVKIYVQAVAISNDGTIDYSPIVLVK